MLRLVRWSEHAVNDREQVEGGKHARIDNAERVRHGERIDNAERVRHGERLDDSQHDVLLRPRHLSSSATTRYSVVARAERQLPDSPSERS